MSRVRGIVTAAASIAALGFGAAQLVRTQPPLLADSPARCSNKKLPGYFVSDPEVVKRAGGKPALYVEGPTEEFDVSPTARPAGANASSAAPPAHRTGTAALRMVSVGRPDAGTLLLAIANNEADREMGLMCVTSMAPRVGMIFVFATETLENFWMKDTLIPLDMVFVSGTGRVTAIAANVPSSRLDQAESTLARRAGKGRFVIELNAGEAARGHITVGSKLEIPKLAASD